jgi:hypothetical protein
MNVEIGTEAEQFPEKEYINEIFVAVQQLGLTDTGKFCRLSQLLESPKALRFFSRKKVQNSVKIAAYISATTPPIKGGVKRKKVGHQTRLPKQPALAIKHAPCISLAVKVSKTQDADQGLCGE